MQKHMAAIIGYANVPRQCRIDPTFCPTPWRLHWDTFFALKHKYPNYLNYPLLYAIDRFITHHYFISTLQYAIRVYEEVTDLAYRMLVKIAHMLLLIVYCCCYYSITSISRQGKTVILIVNYFNTYNK